MKKQKLSIITLMIIAFVGVFLLGGCNSKTKESSNTTTKENTVSTTSKEKETTTEAHSHSFGEWVTVTEATCGTEGLKKRTCECGEEETEVIPATGNHTYGDFVVIREATCEEEGLQRKTCSVCEDEVDETIPAKGHRYADEFTCHNRTCLDCDHVEKASTSHKWGEWVTVTDATCTEAGSKKRTCEVCAAEDVKEVVVDHNFDENETCTMCKKNVKELFISVPEGYSVTSSVNTGIYNVASTDADVFDFMIPGNILSALKEMGYSSLHVTLENIAPGLADSADKCKMILVAQDKPIYNEETAILYKDWKQFWDDGKKETIELDLNTYAGKDIYLRSNHCDAYPLSILVEEFIDYTAKETLLSNSNNCVVDYVEGKGWVLKPATEGAYYAKISKEVMSYFYNEGYREIRIGVINNLHVEGYSNPGNFVNSTICILPEKAEGGNDWNYCNGFISQKFTHDTETDKWFFTVDMTNEAYDFTKELEIYFVGTDVAKNATPYAYVTDVEFSKPHVWGDWTTETPATCGADGLMKRKCSDCGLEETEVIKATGEHSFGEWTVETPESCETDGLKKRVCTVCQKEETEVISAIGSHTYGEWTIETPATCGADGLKKHVCSVCQKEETEVIPATGEHTFGDWDVVTPAVCGEDGLKKHVCSVCQKEETEAIPATGEHTFGDWITVTPATCSAEGSRKHVCSTCQKEETETIPATGEHTYGEWVTVTPVTCGTDGLRKKVCSVCQAEETEDVTSTGLHTFDENGNCTACGKNYKELLVVAVSKEDGDNGHLKAGVVTSPRTGVYSITAEGNKGIFRITPSVLAYLKTIGYSSIEVTVYAEIPADYSDTKNIYIGAYLDTIENKEGDGKYIYYKSGKNFKKQGYTYTMTVDIDAYSTTGLYVQTNRCNVYPTLLKVSELYEYTKEELLVAQTNCEVVYHEDKGWTAKSTDGAAFYAKISQDVMKHYVDAGYKTLKIGVINNLGIEGYTNTGNFINSTVAILAKNTAGSNDWNYCNGFISQKFTLDNETNKWFFTIDLTDAEHDFTKELSIYFAGTDVAKNATPCAFITDIEFLTE